MGTFSRHSCSKFTLRISHWLPSASHDRASRAPEDYNSINTSLFAILSPCLSFSSILCHFLFSRVLFPRVYHPVGLVTGENADILWLSKQKRVRPKEVIYEVINHYQSVASTLLCSCERREEEETAGRFARYRSHRGTWRKGRLRKRKSGWHVVVR